MNGQWIGQYAGTSTGTLVLDLDDVGDNYLGTMSAYGGQVSLPAVTADISIPKGVTQHAIRLALKAVHRTTGMPLTPEQFEELYPDAVSPPFTDAIFEIAATEIKVNWTTPIGTHGEGQVIKSMGNIPSELKPLEDVRSWSEFKDYATKLEPYRHLFRGHGSDKWKLRTAFHRTGRASIPRFISRDVSDLHRNLSGLTTHRFNLADSFDYAAFIALVQHHGYPTPLIDWSHSPFIAAFFAFRDIKRKDIPDDQRVRILLFDGNAWNARFERAIVIAPAFLHVTPIAPLAINNPRVVPQQAVSIVTNTDDVEAYIQSREALVGETFLRAIDLPANERSAVMRELDLMGINSGSLFPGLDGACHQLRERYFDF